MGGTRSGGARGSGVLTGLDWREIVSENFGLGEHVSEVNSPDTCG